MKVFITKYALTEGIRQEHGKEIEGGYCKAHFNNSWLPILFRKGDWHKTEGEAINKAQTMRERKLTSLKKQIDKLENIFFEIKNPS